MKGDWHEINPQELLTLAVVSASVGVVRLMYLVQRGRRFRWFDLILEPSLAMLAGMIVWALCEVTDMPDVLQGAMTSIGAWGGTRTLHWAELRYFGGTREDDKLKQGKE